MQENTVEKLRQLQALPLAAKLQMSEDLITVLKWLVEKTSVKYGFTTPPSSVCKYWP